MSDLNKYSRQSINQDDIDAVVAVLHSEFLTQGPVVEEFETEISNYVQSQFACAVNSATSGLHISLLALGVGSSDVVWTTSNTFVATVNSILYCGARVELIDVDPLTLNMDLDALEKKLKAANTTGDIPKAIIPVHFGGNPIDMPRIGGLAKQYGFAVIEDASHALGARFDEEPIGSCRWSDLTVFSFHPVKPITCGEGGVVTCNSPKIIDRLISLRSHGIQRNNTMAERSLPYEQVTLGFNYRLSDIHAALGKSQLTRSDKYIAYRAELRELYGKSLDHSQVKLQSISERAKSSHHLLVAQFRNENTRNQIKKRLLSEKVGVNFHYTPIYQHSFHRELGTDSDFPNIAQYFRTGITLPLHVNLSPTEVQSVCQIINEELE